ncbi:hypothetical protein, partial [Stutzerimonas balearica]|uniref:hypothetical protein n=1 Tax=Stutzerimonas balearica TaxID=74829 RepID=UPI0032B1DF9F
MAIGLLARLAAARPAPVFVALGMHSGPVREALALDPRVELVDSPGLNEHAVRTALALEDLPRSLERVRTETGHARVDLVGCS